MRGPSCPRRHAERFPHSVQPRHLPPAASVAHCARHRRGLRMSELALLFLLLPVAALSGWIIGRRGSERSSGARVSELSTNYFRGLNYLLNEQQDKAIEVFLKLAEINRDTVETHL